MLEDARRQVDSSIVPLLKGIVEDTQKLLTAEIRLAKAELREDAKRARESVVSFGAGIVAALTAVMALALTMVHGLIALFPQLPLWGAYGATALLFLLIAVFALRAAIHKVTAVKVIPEKTVETMRENVQWLGSKT